MSAKKTRPKKKAAARQHPVKKKAAKKAAKRRAAPSPADKVMDQIVKTVIEAMNPLALRIEALEGRGRDTPAPPPGAKIGSAGGVNLTELACQNRERLSGLVERLGSLAHRLGLPQDPRPSAQGDGAVAARDSLSNVLDGTKALLNTAHGLLDALDANT